MPKTKSVPFKLIIPTLIVLLIGTFFLMRSRRCMNSGNANLTLMIPSLNDGVVLSQALRNRKLSSDESALVEDFEKVRLQVKSWLHGKLARADLARLESQIQLFFERGDRLIGLALYNRAPLAPVKEIPHADFLEIWRNDKANYFERRKDLAPCVKNNKPL